MSSTVIFTAGAKGGSGKTTAARFLITYLREHGTDPMLLDLDDENHTLTRFFPEALQIDLRHEFAHDVLIEKALSGDHQIMVADLKAGTGHEVLEWFLDLPFEELQARGVQFVCVGSVTSAPDSVQSFLNWTASLENHVRYLVFRNLKDGDNLYDYDQTRQAAEFRRLYAPVHVTVPKLSPLYQTELEIRKLTIDEVLDSTNGTSSRGNPLGPILSPLLARARLRSYQRAIYEQLDQAQPLFLSDRTQPVELDPDVCAGEPLEGSGFEKEIPETDFEWRS